MDIRPDPHWDRPYRPRPRPNPPNLWPPGTPGNPKAPVGQNEGQPQAEPDCDKSQRVSDSTATVLVAVVMFLVGVAAMLRSTPRRSRESRRSGWNQADTAGSNPAAPPRA